MHFIPYVLIAEVHHCSMVLIYDSIAPLLHCSIAADTSASLCIDNTLVSVLWQWAVGEVVVVFRPKIMPAREQGRFSLSVNQRGNLTRLGRAKDFGLCGAPTARGDKCGVAINKAAVRVHR
jgi:hypothetical protein